MKKAITAARSRADLFHIHPVRQAPRSDATRHAFTTLVDFCRSRQKAAFQEIKTPLLYSKTLWETSGHWGKYRENMFLVLNTETNEHDMSLKPMNCPSHHLYYGTKQRSYRDLPLRYVTFDVLHRNEISGALSGLTRVRQFAQDIATSICARIRSRTIEVPDGLHLGHYQRSASRRA